MTLPTYAEWIRDTKRTGKPRSKALEKVDAALLAYTGDPGKKVAGAPTRTNLNTLDAALTAWIGDKGGDTQNTIRNYRGMVDKLVMEVRQAKVARMGGAVILPPAIGAHVVTEVNTRQRAIDLNSRECTIQTHQRLLYPKEWNDGVSPKTTNFEWTTVFTLTLRRKFLEVMVRIKPTVVDALGPGAKDYKSTWGIHVASAWKGARLMFGGDSYEIDCRLEFVDNGYGGACYEVDVANPPPPPVPADWKAQQAAKEKVTVGTDVGTPHMGQWGANDRTAVAHEYGHMLGLPDEYFTTQYQHMAVPAEIYNQKPFTTNSLMNNTGPKGRIFARHYSTIKRQFELWQCLTDGATQVLVNG